MPTSVVTVHGQGAQAAADIKDVRSQETYIGYLPVVQPTIFQPVLQRMVME
jgi:hypothetical protein